LVETFIEDFAAWLLQAEVVEAPPLNVELPGQPQRVDQLFRVELVDDRKVKLHIEFQGIRSHEPMPLRMLDYMVRHIRLDPDLDLHSVVFYIGRGAGAHDDGVHEIAGADGLPIMRWRYQVLHLWQMRAQELMALERPALLPLVGLTVIDEPVALLPEVVDSISTVPDVSMRQRLVTSLVTLLNDEEMTTMIEQLVENEEFLVDSPYIRRIREKARIEAITEGRTEGRAEGRAEGALAARRKGILNVLVWRFDPPASVYQQIENVLERIIDEELLNALHKSAVQSAAVADFQQFLQATITPETEPSQ
jgi:predicted transposase YdaD